MNCTKSTPAVIKICRSGTIKHIFLVLSYMTELCGWCAPAACLGRIAEGALKRNQTLGIWLAGAEEEGRERELHIHDEH